VRLGGTGKRLPEKTLTGWSAGKAAGKRVGKNLSNLLSKDLF
jgi:hypothetical protein